MNKAISKSSVINVNTVIGNNCVVVGDRNTTNGYSTCVLIGNDMSAHEDYTFHVKTETVDFKYSMTPEEAKEITKAIHKSVSRAKKDGAFTNK